MFSTNRRVARALMSATGGLVLVVVGGCGASGGEEAEQGGSTTPVASATGTPAAGATAFSVVGDSYSQGPGTDGELWWHTVAKRHGLVPKGSPVGGTGYCAGQERAFRSQVDEVLAVESRAVAVVGSRNDASCDPEEVERDAREVLTRVRDGAHGARVVVVGPLWDSSTPSPEVVAASEATRRAAESVGLPFVDGLSFNGLRDHPELVQDDHVHPNPRGVDALTNSLDGALSRAGAFG